LKKLHKLPNYVRTRKAIRKLETSVRNTHTNIHLTVIYEDDFLKKVGKRRLEAIRDDTLDFIIDLRFQIKRLENNLKIDENE
jgi:hypothetical protein